MLLLLSGIRLLFSSKHHFFKVLSLISLTRPYPSLSTLLAPHLPQIQFYIVRLDCYYLLNVIRL